MAGCAASKLPLPFLKLPCHLAVTFAFIFKFVLNYLTKLLSKKRVINAYTSFLIGLFSFNEHFKERFGKKGGVDPFEI